MTNKLDQLDHDHVNYLLDSLEEAFRGGDGPHELRDAFEQYLVLSDDCRAKKLATKKMFDSLMVALMEFENAHRNPPPVSWEQTNPN